jgi:hypothetical protein
MGDERTLPRLRSDLQIIPVDQDGRRLFVIQDPLKLAPAGTVLDETGMSLLLLLNEADSLADLQVVLTRLQGGLLVSREQVVRIVQEFDRHALLESESFRRRKAALLEEFLNAEERAPALAGSGYPAERDELESFLSGILEGAPSMAGRVPEGVRIKVLIAPHIDLQVGARVYASAFAAWPETAPRRILLLGTGHGIARGNFSVTRKHYRTPLGLLRTDRAAAERLLDGKDPALAPDDFAHRSEHSLEFQALFIQHRLAGRECLAVPVLCGAFSGILESTSDPASAPALRGFFERLRPIAQDPETLIVAGIDLCHIGPKFGHPRPARELEEEAQKHDRALLEALISGDLSAFWGEARRVEDRYNVCGLSTLTTLLACADGLRGTVLDYNMWHEEPTHSAVSFAAAVLWEE